MESNGASDTHDHQDGESPQIVLNGDFLPAQFRTQSYEVARDAVRFISRGDDYCQPPSRSSSVMRDLVKDTIRARAGMMSELVQTLDVQRREQLALIKNIANSMFDDEKVTWGRIVTLHAFCGCLAKYCEATFIPDCADDIGNILGDFVVHRLGLWIVTHGGWVSVFIFHIIQTNVSFCVKESQFYYYPTEFLFVDVHWFDGTFWGDLFFNFP